MNDFERKKKNVHKKKKEKVRSKQHHMQRSPSKAMPFDSQILKQKELGESQTFILLYFGNFVIGFKL